MKNPEIIEVDGFTNRHNNVGTEMDNTLNTNQGIRLLVQKCRKEFRLSENTDFNSEKDYKTAERKFVKFCFRGKFKPSFHLRVNSK